MADTTHGIGIMSGTSCDGVDVALVRFCGEGPAMELVDFIGLPYEASLRERLLAPRKEAKELCLLHFLLGHCFADAALKMKEKAIERGLTVAFAACHGHTVAHYPPEGTMQIGEAALIAEKTGLTVVSDFRPSDMAAGGQGAPLVPYADWVLFRDAEKTSACLNIGGIANVTVVTPDLKGVFAFDTGPGNMIIDGVMAKKGKAFDQDGAAAARGTVLPDLLETLLDHPYFRRPPPKSTGREEFGAHVYLEKALAPDQSLEDQTATATEAVAQSIASAFKTFIFPTHPLTRLVVSGGGAFNPFLMSRLREALSPLPVLTGEEAGIRSDAKEALAFALLGYETLRRRPANVPAATGASKPVILGKITPAPA